MVTELLKNPLKVARPIEKSSRFVGCVELDQGFPLVLNRPSTTELTRNLTRRLEIDIDIKACKDLAP